MWFPAFFTRFLPGWIINIALIVHSDEALLAAGFIFSIHFFNTHFRIEKFPMDTVIFSGRVSKNEMLHERRRWYDRLVAEGRLDEHRVRDEWLRWKSIARSFGYFFFGLGVLLLAADHLRDGHPPGASAGRAKKCEANAKQCRVVSAASRNPDPIWVFSDMR